jgi:PIN like domain
VTREATVRFYVDADLLGLAKTLSLLRADVTYPGDPGGRVRKRIRPPCPVTSPATKDREWIPVVTQLGWVILTRDSRIQEHRAEIDAVRTHGARMIVLAGKEAVDTWHQLEVIMCVWRQVERCCEHPGPFIYTATRSGLREVTLSGNPPQAVR